MEPAPKVQDVVPPEQRVDIGERALGVGGRQLLDGRPRPLLGFRELLEGHYGFERAILLAGVRHFTRANRSRAVAVARCWRGGRLRVASCCFWLVAQHSPTGVWRYCRAALVRGAVMKRLTLGPLQRNQATANDGADDHAPRI